MGVKPSVPVIVPRYYLFAGCGDEDCGAPDHPHERGWYSVAAASNDLKEIHTAVMYLDDERYWWQVVDITTQAVILSSLTNSAPRH